VLRQQEPHPTCNISPWLSTLGYNVNMSMDTLEFDNLTHYLIYTYTCWACSCWSFFKNISLTSIWLPVIITREVILQEKLLFPCKTQTWFNLKDVRLTNFSENFLWYKTNKAYQNTSSHIPWLQTIFPISFYNSQCYMTHVHSSCTKPSYTLNVKVKKFKWKPEKWGAI